jgi:isoprenylcysteine carboxyl methyltransferase (ICMT) family protein YpbQ
MTYQTVKHPRRLNNLELALIALRLEAWKTPVKR